MSSGGGEKEPLVTKERAGSAEGADEDGITRSDSKPYYFAPLKSRQNTMVST